jgi:hypothetical protein
VDDGGALGVVLLDGLKDGQAGERRSHSDGDKRTRTRTRAAGKERCRCRVPAEGTEEGSVRPHGHGSAWDQRIRLQMQAVGERQLCGGCVRVLGIGNAGLK